MDKDIKTKWVAALRSGEYQQGKKYLCKLGVDGVRKWCCLGVLCHIMGVSESNYREGYTAIAFGELKMIDFPELETLHKAGLIPCQAHDLAHANDSGKTFSTIADHIERFH